LKQYGSQFELLKSFVWISVGDLLFICSECHI